MGPCALVESTTGVEARGMTRPLNVLLLESNPWAGEVTAQRLTEDGYRVHRCHERGDNGFACVGLGPDPHCPLDDHVDVAILVRADNSTGPTPHEDGVRCAIRAGVPLVEVSDGGSGPYAQWVALHADETTATAACATAVELARQPMAAAVVTRLGPLLAEAGLSPDDVECRIGSNHPDLDVTIEVPGPVDRPLEQALSVRAYDALRPMTLGYKTVNVTVHGIP